MPERPEQLVQMATDVGFNLAIGFAVLLFVCLLVVATDTGIRSKRNRRKKP